MAAKRLYSPSVMIGATEYKCKLRSVSLEPGDWINFCEQEWTFSAEIELGYGTLESWTTLNAIADTIVVIVLKPEDSATSVSNPKATFSVRWPSIAFMTDASRGDRMTFTVDVVTEAAPVFAIV